MKHFTIIELGADSESPMIGTICDVIKLDLLTEYRFHKAIQEHFDCAILQMDMPDLFTGSPYEDVFVELDDDGDLVKVRILETWLY